MTQVHRIGLLDASLTRASYEVTKPAPKRQRTGGRPMQSDAEIAEIRWMHEKEGLSMGDIALLFGLPYKRVYQICSYVTRSSIRPHKQPACVATESLLGHSVTSNTGDRSGTYSALTDGSPTLQAGSL